MGRPEKTSSCRLIVLSCIITHGHLDRRQAELRGGPKLAYLFQAQTEPTNNGAPSNMIQVSANVYDGGGDGNLTQQTVYPGGPGASGRVFQFFFDWRNRLVAAKSGYEASESTSLNRPIFYFELDNVGQVIAREQYDGDGVAIVKSGTVQSFSQIRSRQSRVWPAGGCGPAEIDCRNSSQVNLR